MKLYKQILIILVVFFKTETLFSQNNLFNVNNIKLEKKDNTTNKALADNAIKKGFDKLTTRILLKEDSKKLLDLKFSSIKQLVTYYQVTNISKGKEDKELVNFSVTFAKDKIHDLFYKKGISYSEILNKELYILPVLIKNNEIFIFNNNFFYKNWNEVYKNGLIEFILPLENIEIIQNVNDFKKNLINLDITKLFKEYTNTNLALILIENNKNLSPRDFDEKVIIEIKKELTNLIKSKNLIDIRTPFFLNAKLDLNKRSNLVELNSRIKKIDSIENIFVQEFNKDYMNLRIK